MNFIFVSKKVENRIRDLKKTGKAGRTLAHKAESIIKRLALGRVCHHHTDKAGSLTKYGEKRIRGCKKYDLGCGHRMITLERASTVYLAFLGSHDECRSWLAGNSRLKDFTPGVGQTIPVGSKRKQPVKPEESDSQGNTLLDEDDPLREFTDQELRRVFSGLTGTQQ